MVENDEQQEKGKDPFADFLFGSRSRKSEDKLPGSNYDWILGRNGPNKEPEANTQKEESSTPLEKVMNNVNIPELFTHLDTLMTSAQKLKPLYGNIKPIINQFINKK